MQFAGFGRRFVAYWIDAVPITLGVASIFYFFFGFDDTLHRYLRRAPDDFAARHDFILTRTLIRDISLAGYLLYCSVLEASALRGTVGKWVLGIKVVTEAGAALSYAESAKRNVSKFFSFLAFGLGCLAVIWTRNKQGWHDKIARTYVVRRSRVNDENGGH